MRGGPYKIGEVAARTGLTTQALRYYEARGLVHARRTVGGHRLFGTGIVDRVRFIQRAETLGFSLAEIRELLELARGGLPVSEARARARRFRRLIRQRRQALRDLDAALADVETELEALGEDAPAPRSPLIPGAAPPTQPRRR